MIRSFALAALVLAACGKKPSTSVPTPPAPVGACELASAVIRHETAGPCAASDWRLVAGADGLSAEESGCAGARGHVSADGHTVTIEFTYDGGAGLYRWTFDDACGTGSGELRFTEGASAGESYPSTATFVRE